jgi:hypothetical protein
MKRYSLPLYYRLTFLAFMLLYAAHSVFSQHPWHVLLQWAGVALLAWALVLLIIGRRNNSITSVKRCGRDVPEPPLQ